MVVPHGEIPLDETRYTKLGGDSLMEGFITFWKHGVQWIGHNNLLEQAGALEPYDCWILTI